MPRSIHTEKNAQTGALTQHVMPWTKDTLKERVSEVRRERMLAGATVGGVPLSADLVTTANMTAVVVGNMLLNRDSPVAWNVGGTHAMLDPATSAATAGLLFDYGQAVFAREKALYELIDAVSEIDPAALSDALDNIADVELQSGWPG